MSIVTDLRHYHGDAEVVASFDNEDFSHAGRDCDTKQIAVALDDILADLGYAVVQGFNEMHAYYIVELPEGR